MTRLLWPIALAAAWWLGRVHERRQVRAMDERADEMDGVQWDPWTRALSEPGTREALDEGLADLRAGRVRDWTYGEALTQAAIRSTQRDDVTTEGTS